MKSPMYECPSFNVCAAPKCPLDQDIDLRSNRLPGEEKCRSHKPTRVRIGSKYPNLLPYGGLTKREYNGKKAWEGKDSAQREIIVERLAKWKKSTISGITEHTNGGD